MPWLWYEFGWKILQWMDIQRNGNRNVFYQITLRGFVRVGYVFRENPNIKFSGNISGLMWHIISHTTSPKIKYFKFGIHLLSYKKYKDRNRAQTKCNRYPIITFLVHSANTKIFHAQHLQHLLYMWESRKCT